MLIYIVGVSCFISKPLYALFTPGEMAIWFWYQSPETAPGLVPYDIVSFYSVSVVPRLRLSLVTVLLHAGLSGA